MKRAQFRISLAVVFMLLSSMLSIASADDAKEAAIKKDRQQIAGTWRVVSLEVNGVKSSETEAKKITVMNGVDGSWVLRSEGNEIGQGTTTLDPTQSPKAIDIKSTTGPNQDKAIPGIYKLEKNTRKLCFAQAGHTRPTEFSSTAANQQILVTFERVKSE
ncbi:TIGR03067 domain-containing protein [Gimesia sp.]|uniref:TIGR03067 domain-containing protein n=1 Tax=Gimesia sp. TaxID=2024833 RepID=UPI003A8D211A